MSGSQSPPPVPEPSTHSMTCGPRQPVGEITCFPLIILIPFLLIIGCNREPSVLAEGHYGKAQEYLRQNKTAAALIELQRAVQLSPEMGKAHQDLAKLYLQRGEQSEALQQSSMAIRLNPEDHDAYIITAELLLRKRSFSEAKETATELLDKWPQDQVAELILAESVFELNDVERAKELVEGVVHEDPKNSRARFDLAKVQLRNQQWAEAENSLRLAWDLDPRGLVAPLELSNLLERQGKGADAESVLKRTVESHAGNVVPLYVLADLYTKHRELDKAEEIFKQIQTADFANPVSRGSLGVFYAVSGRTEAAEKEFRRIVVANPEDKLNWLRLAAVEITLDRRAEARQIANDLVKKDQRDWEPLLLLGGLDVEDGDADRALHELNQAKAIQPNSAAVYLQLARADLVKGEAESARVALNDALKIAPAYLPARVILAGLELRSGETAAAIQDLNRVIQQEPDSVELGVWLSQAYAKQGEYYLAEQNLDRLLDQATPSGSRAMIFETLAWVKLRQGRFAEATQFATRSLSLGKPTRLELEVLGLSYLGRKEEAQGIEAVQTFLNKADRWPAGQDVLGEVAMRAGKLDVAEKAFQKELEIDPKASSALLGLGEVYLGRRQDDLSRQFYERFAAAEPSNAFVALRLAGLAELSKDWPRAISEYEKAVQLDPSSLVAKNNLAWIYSEHGGRINDALRLAREAQAGLPEDPHVADTLGWILVKSGSSSEAVAYLKICSSKDPSNAVYHYHLGMAYFQANELRKAQDELEAALRLQNTFDGSAEASRTLNTISAVTPN